MKTRVYVSVVVKCDEETLVVKRAQDSKFAPGQWEFINGSIDGDETAEAAAVRELEEEAGIVVDEKSLGKLTAHELQDSDGFWIVIPFIINVSNKSVRLSNEHSDYQWLDDDRLLNTPHVGEDYKILKALIS